jgi:serine/threonine-protein kinase RsbW
LSSGKSLNLNIKADLKEIDNFCMEAEKLLRNNSLGEYVFPVQLLLREALTNAVVHGCRKQSKLMIKCYFNILENEIRMEIKDPGDGFDWKFAQSKDYTLSADSGRGLLIFNKYASEYIYNKAGNGVLIKMIIVQKEKDHE